MSPEIPTRWVRVIPLEEQVSHLSLLVSSEQRRNVFKHDQNVVASSCRSHCPFAVWYGLPKVPRGNCTHNGRKRIFWLPVSSTTKYHRGTIWLDSFQFLRTLACWYSAKPKVHSGAPCSDLKLEKHRFIPPKEKSFLKPVSWGLGLVIIHFTKDI